MLLAVDVGNTLIKLALYRGETRVAHWHAATDRERTADEYAMVWRQFLEFRGYGFADVSAVAIACVVPQLADTLRRLCRDYLGQTPLEVGPGVVTGMRILYDNPREVGADRIANAIAAYARYGGPVIVVALGTATVFTAVSKDGEFLGGAIAPGVGISVEALVQHAAQLRKVELVRPNAVVARNTVAALQAGVLYGVIGQVEGIIARMRVEIGAPATVVATGGFAELVGGECRCVDHVDPLLSLDGLRILHERNTVTPAAGEGRTGVQDTAR